MTFDPAYPAYYIDGLWRAFMATPFQEGRTAGYKNAPAANPYRKGLDALRDADAIVWAQEWDAGYLEGHTLAQDDLAARRLEACR